MKRFGLLFLLIPSFGWATAYTSNSTGFWGTSTVWTPNGVPGNNDTAVISNGNVITSSFSVTVGTSPAGGTEGAVGTDAVKIIGSGQLILSTGEFTTRGDIEITVASNVTLEPGTTLQFDSSQATNPFAQKYRIFTSGTLGYTPLISSCTATAGCWIISNAGGGNGYIDGLQSQENGYGGGVTAQYTTFQNIGDSTNTFDTIWTDAFALTGNDWNVTYSTFSGCGLIAFLSVPSGMNIIHKHNYHTGSLGQIQSGTLYPGVMMTYTTGANSATEEIAYNVFDQPVGGIGNIGGGMYSFNVHDNYFANGINGDSGIWSNLTNNVLRNNAVVAGNAINNYFVYDYYTVPHFHFPDISASVPTIQLSSNVWDTTYVSQAFNLSGDGITESVDPAAITVSYNIDLCGSSLNIGQSLWSMRATVGSTWTVVHNDACPGEYGPIGSYQDSFTPNILHRGSMLNNIWFDTVNNTNNWPYVDTSISGDTDTFAPSSISNNANWNLALTQSGYPSTNQANGYVGFWSVVPGTADIHANPDFVDTTRNFATFDYEYLEPKGLAPGPATSWSAGATYTAGEIISDSSNTYFNGSTITYRCILSTAGATNSIRPGVGSTNTTNYWEMASAYDLRMAVAASKTITDSTLGITNNTYIQALLAWVKAGYAPTNSAYHNTATDGTDIGAVPFSGSSPSTGPFITAAWANDGGDKIPRECWFPHCVNYSSSTINRFWNGTTITPFTAEGELTHVQVIAYDSGTVDADSVTVSMSSMTCSGGTGIVNTVTASSLTVTSFVGRPIRVYSAWYLPNLGQSYFPYGFDEYEERQWPIDMRVPCTIVGIGQCAPNGSQGTGTWTWLNRLEHNMSLPVTWIPNEEFAPVSTSSYTVFHSSSMAWDIDVWTSSSIPAGTCTGTFNIFEGSNLSQSLPVSMKVYGVQMPQTTAMPVIGYTYGGDTNKRLNGNSAPSLPVTGSYLSARQASAQALKENGIQIQGDGPDVSTNNYWSLEYSSYVTGAAFTPALGYANAPGVGVGNSQYVISQYGDALNFAGGTQSQFCVQVSSWLAGCEAANEQCILYTPSDEVLAPVVSSITVALQTNSQCSYNGQTLPLMQTYGFPDTISTAPYTAYPTSTGFFDDFAPSSTTWQSVAQTLMSGAGLTGNLGRLWVYNDDPFNGAIWNYEEEGYVPQNTFWQKWKKLCAENGGVCKGGYMLWETNYWTNSDSNGGCGNGGLGGGGNGPGTNNLDVMHNPCTFGYAASTDASRGVTGEDYTQGDGVLLFPGTDVIYSSASWGFNGVTEAYNLKQIGTGIDTMNYLQMAYSVNPSSTIAVYNSMVSGALWEVSCVENYPGGDCSYSVGDRSWSYGANNWTMARESLLEIIAAGPPPTSPSGNVTINGKSKFSGRAVFY